MIYGQNRIINQETAKPKNNLKEIMKLKDIEIKIC
jgi:hypothetical protein